MLLLPVTTALLTFGSTLTIVLLTCCNGCKKRSKKKATNKNKEKGALDTRSDAEPTAETQQLAPAPFPYQIQLLQPPFTPMPSTDATQQQQAAQRQDATGTTNEQTAQQKSAGGNTAAQPTTTQMLPPMMMMGAQPGQPTLLFCLTPQGFVPVQVDPALFYGQQSQFQPAPADQQSTTETPAAVRTAAAYTQPVSSPEVPGASQESATTKNAASGVQTAMVLSGGADSGSQAQQRVTAMYDVPDDLTSRTEEDGAVPKTEEGNEKPKTLELYDNLPTV